MIDAVTKDLNRYLKKQDELQAYDTALDAKQEEIYDMTVWQFMKLLDAEIDRETLALLVEEEADRQVRAVSDDFEEPDDDSDTYWFRRSEWTDD
jgi:hypothetical protein